MELESIVPWGRGFGEYLDMFSLADDHLKSKILSVADGPASFNAELTLAGGNVRSVDPIYQFSKAQIKSRIDEVHGKLVAEILKNHDKFVWDTISSVEQLSEVRMQAMNCFLSDFDSGKVEKRYIEAQLPKLPFQDNEFDLCLCSHFLFLYSDHLSLEFHKSALDEMIRIAKEIRVFPLLDLAGNKSKFVEPLFEYLSLKGHSLTIKKVNYEFQRNANEMLIINT